MTVTMKANRIHRFGGPEVRRSGGHPVRGRAAPNARYGRGSGPSACGRSSVKQPGDTLANVIEPYRRAAAERGGSPLILATRWTLLAETDDAAWQCLLPMRGLRAPGRLETCDPAELRMRADQLDRAELLNSYTRVRDAAELIDAYRPLVTDIGADIVSVQVMSQEPMATIQMIGKEVLPALRSAAP